MQSFNGNRLRFVAMACVFLMLVRGSVVLAANSASAPASAPEIVLYDNIDLAGPGVIQGYLAPGGPHVKLAQQFFTYTADNVSSVTFKLTQFVSPPTGSIAIEIWDDDGSGGPGESVGTLGTIDIGTLTASYDFYTVEGVVSRLKPHSQYYVVVDSANAAIDPGRSFGAATVNRADGTGDPARFLGWRRSESGWEVLWISKNEPQVSYLRMKVTASKRRQSFAPQPAEEATDVHRDVILSWTPGETAAPIDGHIVYFSENFDDVSEGIGGVTVSSDSYDPGRLDFNQTYYWRVDEVNGTPDFTVFEGDVWSFTTEPVAYPITNITATASSALRPETTPGKTVDGSGLTEDRHSTEAEDMWISGALPAWIEYAFDRPYKLQELWIWNANQGIEPFVGLGAKQVVIEHSLNGIEWTILEGVTELTQATGIDEYVANNVIEFNGSIAQFVRIQINSVHGPSPQASLSEVRFLHEPVFARNPEPGNGEVEETLDTVLAWRPGRGAGSHEVFLSDAMDEVVEESALIASTQDASFDLSGQNLEYGTKYFWKINEVNDLESPAVHAGDLWHFETPEFISVDDMEVYADEVFLEIWAHWVDGLDNPANGSIVGNENEAERDHVLQGEQSLPMVYDNDQATFSEATRIFEPALDWIRGDPAILSISFLGDPVLFRKRPVNDPAPLYVMIEDSAGQTLLVEYPDPAATLIVEWTEWVIPLSELGSLDLSAIKFMTLGVGGGGSSGTGKMFFDNIRVGSPRPQAP